MRGRLLQLVSRRDRRRDWGRGYPADLRRLHRVDPGRELHPGRVQFSAKSDVGRAWHRARAAGRARRWAVSRHSRGPHATASIFGRIIADCVGIWACEAASGRISATVAIRPLPLPRSSTCRYACCRPERFACREALPPPQFVSLDRCPWDPLSSAPRCTD
jgi:hypothetical protein